MNETDYVAYHGWVWLKNAINSHQFGLRVQLKLCHEDDLKVFQGIKKHRKKRAGSGSYRIFTRIDPKEESWYGPVDMLFITWAHSISNGVTVTFEIADQAEWETLRGRPALAAGYEEGQLDKVEIMMVELNDEGKPINVEQRAKMEKMAREKSWGKGGPQSIRAARLGRDKDFIDWVVLHKHWKTDMVSVSPQTIAEWMRGECDIDTRRQLDHDPAALQRFEDRVMSPFLRSTM